MRLKYNEENHAYWLDGDRCRGGSALSKIGENNYNLDRWRERTLVFGLSQRHDLLEKAASHFDQAKIVDGCIRDAINHAGGESKANMGTAAHRIAQRRDQGETIIDTPLSRLVLAQWDALVADAGLEIVPEYIECAVVFPEEKWAGRFDRYMRHTETGTLVVVDLKTGLRAIEYPRPMTKQLGFYANAPLVARGIVPDKGGNWETEAFEPTPAELDRRWGYIFHLPIDGTPASAHRIDIAAGWDFVRSHVVPTLAWQKKTDLIWPVKFVDGGSSPAPTVPESTPEAPVVADPARRAALIERLKALGPDDQALMASRWPVGVPGFKQSDAHTDWQLDLIDKVLSGIDWIDRAQEPTGTSVVDRVTSVGPVFPTTVDWVADEVRDLTTDEYDSIAGWFLTCSDPIRDRVQKWTAEAHAAGRSFSLKGKPTARRAAILFAAVACAELSDDEVRAVLSAYPNLDVNALGWLFGSLTLEEAERISEALADAHVAQSA